MADIASMRTSSSSTESLSNSSSTSRSRAGGAFLMLFGSVFSAAGLAVLAFMLPDALEQNEQEGIVVSSVIGVLFTCVGFGIVWLGLSSQRLGRERDALVRRHPNAPWMWNPEWARREIQGSSATVMIFLWVFAGIWNAIAWPIVPKLIEEISRNNTGAAAGLLFPVIGIAIGAAAVHSSLRARRFGRSVFQLDTLPGVIGGELVGTVRVSKTLPASEGLRARLVCVNRVTTGSGKNSSTREHVLYEEKQEIAPNRVRPGPQGSEIPLQFLIPFENPDSNDENSRNTIQWRIEIEGDFKGVDYSTQFEIPVFKTDASSPDVCEPGLAPEQLDQALAGEGALVGSKVQVMTLPGDAVALYFRAARNPGGAFTLTVFAAIWGGITGFLATGTDAPLFMTAVFGFFEVLMVFGVLSMWFSSTRVCAGQDGLIVEGGLFGLGRQKSLTAGEIDSIEMEVGLQQGSKIFYRLRAHHGRASTGCGSGIPDKAEALALAALLSRALGVDTTKAVV